MLACLAEAGVVELHLLNFVERTGVEVATEVVVDLHIVDAATVATHEVGMGREAGVVVHVALVDVERHHSMLLLEKVERVVDRGARERGDGLQQVVVDGVDGGMREVLHQVFHDGHALHRWADAVFNELLFCCIQFKNELVIFL